MRTVAVLAVLHATVGLLLGLYCASILAGDRRDPLDWKACILLVLTYVVVWPYCLVTATLNIHRNRFK